MIFKDFYDIVTPYRESQLNPNSYDLTLARDFLYPKKYKNISKYLLEDEIEYETKHDCVTVHPNEFILASTLESVNIPCGKCGFVQGKSSVGRYGLMVHVTAGFVDAGFNGNITLEIVNVAPYAINLRWCMPIAQLIIMDAAYNFPYNGHYQNQKGTTPPFIYES